jgi:hypothetical protein
MKLLSLGILSTLLLSTTSFGASLNKEIKNSALVIYNNSLGLVHEERSLEVKKSDTNIVYEGVANTIDTDSVNIKLADSIHLNSQQYRFDKLTPQKLLDAHIGKSINVKVLKDPKSFKTIKATLMSNSANTALVRLSNSKIISVDTKDIIFKNIPKELITKPSLVWNITADKDLKTDLELDYLINNISWKSDYILNLTKDTAHLSGWISIDNRSGKNFENTQLNVLAGDINLERDVIYQKNKNYLIAETAPVQHQSHEGYHIYSLPFKINLANNEKTQIKFIDKSDIKIDRIYNAMLTHPLYASGQTNHDVTQYVHIKGLDVALPKGVVRTYSKLTKQNILLAQTRIAHTPKNSPIELKIGTNFDIKVKQTVIKKADDKFHLNSTLEYEVSNFSDEEKSITLQIPFNTHKDSKIKTKVPYKIQKGNLVTFTLSIPAQSSKKIHANFISKK